MITMVKKSGFELFFSLFTHCMFYLYFIFLFLNIYYKIFPLPQLFIIAIVTCILIIIHYVLFSIPLYFEKIHFIFLFVLLFSLSTISKTAPFPYVFRYILHVFMISLIYGILLFSRYRVIIASQKNVEVKRKQDTASSRSFLSTYGWYILLLLIIVFGFFLRIHYLGSFDLFEDEFQVVGAAGSYVKTGMFLRWNWISGEALCNNAENCMYTRALPHSWLIALSYRIFGVSEWSSRIVSVLFGTLFIWILYIFATFFTQRRVIGLFAAGCGAVYHYYIWLSRFSRMYALLVPVFILFIYLFYRGITETYQFPEKLQQWKVIALIQEYASFHYPFLFISVPLLIFGVLLHINMLCILPAFFLFILYLALFQKEKKYVLCVYTGLIGLFCFLLYRIIFPLQAMKILQYFTFFEMRNFSYLFFSTQFPFSFTINMILLCCGLAFIFSIKEQKLQNKFVFLYMSIIFSLVFYMFIADRYDSNVYIVHITPIVIVLVVAIYLYFIRIWKSELVRVLLLLILFSSLLFSFIDHVPPLYSKKGDVNYSSAYKVIINHYNPETEVIFGQYLRTYYLQELSDVTIVDMESNQDFSYSAFSRALKRHNQGWMVWAKEKFYHLKPEVHNYIQRNFKKVRGSGIDNNKVEIYYFNESMIR